MKYFLTLLLGAALGGVLVYFLFVGAPRARQAPGEAVRAPDPSGPPPGTAVVELDEAFFNTLLDSIFKDLGQPTFRLGSQLIPAGREDGFAYVRAQVGCASQVVIAPEGG